AAAISRPRELPSHAVPAADALRSRLDLQQPVPVVVRTTSLHRAAVQARPPPRARRAARRARDHFPVLGAHGLAPRLEDLGPATISPTGARVLRLRAAVRAPVERH